MKKILLVCLGNICRSPMAEGIVRKVLADRGVDVQVDSAGTIGFHVGEGADHRAQYELRKHNIDISDERAQQFKASHFNEYDLIFTMDKQNFADVIMQAKDDKQKSKVDMLMNIKYPEQDISVPDPYYGGDEGFAIVYEMINEAAEALVDRIR